MTNPPECPGLAYRLSMLARAPGMHVYICPDLRSYRRLAEELGFFLQDSPELLWRFPAWEVLPYDRVSPHHALVGERLATLSRLLKQARPKGLLLTALPAWLQRILPAEAISAHVWDIKAGDRLDITTLKERLALAGMRAVERVMERGEFAARGGLLDIWPATEHTPLRLDMFADEIESIRRFDPESQRSAESLDSFTSVPVREVILDEAGRQRFAAAFLTRFPQLRAHPMLAAVKAGRPHPGIESLLPLAYERCSRLPDYLPADTRVFSEPDLEQERGRFGEQVRSQFELTRMSREPVIAPQELYAVETPVCFEPVPADIQITSPPQISAHQQSPRPLHALLAELESHTGQGWRLLLVAHGPGQQERMVEAMKETGLETHRCQGLHDLGDASVCTALGLLHAGFCLPHAKLMVLTGSELLGQRLPRRRSPKPAAAYADLFASLRELNAGDAVVHEDHGIGRYQGLVNIQTGGVDADYLHIEYAGDASIYLPVEELDRLHRYSGEESPQLNKLGSERWKLRRERARRDILAIAHDIIAVDAGRRKHTRPGIRMEQKEHAAYEEFTTRFPFEETDDQHDAIEAVVTDLAAGVPADRVICGDVGFGKTEVAMRAAFIMAQAGRQVALLAPTTVLASQHYATFCDRFSGTGIRVTLLSRLQGKAESERNIKALEAGDTSIIIGTHRLLSADVRFFDLGLVIVDEEHRFGVKHKEKLKALHAGIDLITLTATPIPRTLHQALSGMRAVSIISTPPAEREAIRTMVAGFDEHLAAEAIRRELYRGGQIYYVHNHVKSIERIAARLRETVPEAEIGIAHGQMNPSELDRQMMAFYEGRLHILVCTTIIESGLDVPNANTLLVERADLLGLAQLHQIRGRVGRSHQQAYAYFFTPDHRSMTREAAERLDALAAHTELGAGFLLAREDMEIRGAGNLLGAEQSGHIEAIGLDLYLDMLTDAVAEAQGQPVVTQHGLDIHLGVSAVLPEDYIPQIGERLNIYRRIAGAGDDTDISQLFEEVTDRFGRMPPESRNCLEAARIRWRARRMGLSRLEAGDKGLRLVFTEQSPVNRDKLLARVQADPECFRLKPDGSLSLNADLTGAEQRLAACIAFLDELLTDSASC